MTTQTSTQRAERRRECKRNNFRSKADQQRQEQRIEAYADHIVEKIMHRRNASTETRLKLREYIDSILVNERKAASEA